MPFKLKAQRHVVKKGRKSGTLNEVLPPGELVDVASLKGRNRDFLQASFVSMIALPGGIEFAINGSTSNAAHTAADHGGSGEDNSGQFPVPLQDYSIESDDEEDNRKHRNRSQARRSKAKVAARWSDEVIPRILPIYVKHQARCSRGSAHESDHEALPELCRCQAIMRQKIIVLRLNCEYMPLPTA
jgi:hypothetical protein